MQTMLNAERMTSESNFDLSDNKYVPVHNGEIAVYSGADVRNGTRGEYKTSKIRPLSCMWRGVLLIATFILLGVAFAIGHDQYNRFLDGHPTNDYYLSQKWVSRIQTAFAFLVKTCLAASITTAYAQRMWHLVQRHALTVGNVDTLMAVPTTLPALLDFRGWTRAPVLLLMGAMIWLLPFAAVVAPGSLTVAYSCVTNVTHLQVPQLSYEPDMAESWASHGSEVSYYEFWSASATVQRVGFASATTSTILTVSPLYANQTYNLTFWAPAVQCATADSDVRQAAEEFWEGMYSDSGQIAYYSWVGDYNCSDIQTNETLVEEQRQEGYCPSTTLDLVSTDAATIYVFAAINMTGPSNDVTECRLYNASYDATFQTVAGTTTVTANVQVTEPLAAVPTVSDIYDTVVPFKHYMFQSVMDVFGELLVGLGYERGYGIQVTDSSFQRLSVNFENLTQTAIDLERLFHSIVLSLLSSSDLCLNSSLAKFVPTEVVTYPLTFKYEPYDLWAAYGVSILVTLAAAIVGLSAIWDSGASFSFKFSTAVRVAVASGLHHALPVNDNGSDPLPKEIQQILVNAG